MFANNRPHSLCDPFFLTSSSGWEAQVLEKSHAIKNLEDIGPYFKIKDI